MRILSAATGVVLTAATIFGLPAVNTDAAQKSTQFKQKIEFETAKRFENNGQNKIESSKFSNYSGSGYLYLASGWGEVGFTVPSDGEYKITLVSNADSYKENWLYLDDNGAGTLYTTGNKWDKYTATYKLTKGTHKFGVSTSWGYTALDYVEVESVGNVETEQTTEQPTETTTEQPTEKVTETTTEQPTQNTGSTSSVSVYEFENQKHFEQNGRNRVESSQFSGYSGNGYVYLESGWGEVQFNVSKAGNYRLTMVTNADSYKENYLYLDDNGAGTLQTSGNKWESYTKDVYLSAGTHKFGISTSWGYTALDCVKVQALDGGSTSGGNQQETTTGKQEESTSKNTDSSTQGKSLYVQNGKLYDGNGKEFMMRGINVAHAWYKDYTETSINAIANLGANCVRVVLADGSQWTKTTRSEVENIIKWCRNKGLVCVLEVHDHTGYDDTSRLDSAVNYWLEIKDLVNANKDYVIVNIANEWLGTWGKGSTWRDAYQSAIKKLRNNGIENVIMVDAAGYGQETSSLIDNCQSVAAADPKGNTMFSIHMYSVAGANASTVRSNIDSMLSKGVAFCIGEFGDYQNGGDVDEKTIMEYCTQKSVGYIAWSWKGNGGTDVNLDLANTWDGSSLTNWGNYVVNASGIGIKATSKKAYN